MSTLKTRLETLIGAGQPYIMVRTDEPNEVEQTLATMQFGHQTYNWDILRGLHQFTEDPATGKRTVVTQPNTGGDSGGFQETFRKVFELVAASRADEASRNVIYETDGVYAPALIVMSNLNLACKSVIVRQCLMNMNRQCELHQIHVVAICGSLASLPEELDPQFETIEHELPDAAELARVTMSVGEILEQISSKRTTPAYIAKVAEAGLGMTRNQMRNAVAAYLFDPVQAAESFNRESMKLSEFVFRSKCSRLNQEGLVKVLVPEAGFDSLGGMEAMKKFHLAVLKTQNGSHIPDCRVNGTLLVSFPGAGKTAFASALAYEIDSGAVLMDFGQMLGGIVGESEAKTRRAFNLVEAIAPPQKRKKYEYTDSDRKKFGDAGKQVFDALDKLTDNYLIVIWDEVEKGLQGADSAVRDGGVGMKQLSYVLTWLSGRKSKTFVIATANQGDKLHEALTRAERFDKMFFVDKPSTEQKKLIWNLYLKKFELEDQPLPPDDNWTGAEIRSCCRLAKIQGQPLVAIAESIVPIYAQHGDRLKALEDWAKTCCISSETGRVYGKATGASQSSVTQQDVATGPSRRIVRPNKPRDN